MDAMHPFWHELLRKLFSWHAAVFVTDLLGKIIVWPTAFICLGLLFRRPISQMIERIERLAFKGGGAEAEVTSPRSAEEQQREAAREVTAEAGQLGQAKDTSGVVVFPSAQADVLSEEVRARRRALESAGGEHPVLTSQVQAIRADLNALGYGPTEETISMLVRQVAVVRITNRMEVLYRVIFGSQIRLLTKLKSEEVKKEEAHRLYKTAKQRSPKFYGTYDFEDWLNFLTANGLVIATDDLLSIAPMGQAFLEFIAEYNLPKKRF